VTVLCHALGLWFAFTALIPYAPVTYDYQPATTAWSSR
jgi:hypothetical protein